VRRLLCWIWGGWMICHRCEAIFRTKAPFRRCLYCLSTKTTYLGCVTQKERAHA